LRHGRVVDATLSASAGVATARAPGRGRGVSIARPLAGPASAGKQHDPKSCSLRWPRIPSALVDPQQNATRPWTLLLVSASDAKQQSHGTKSSRSTLPVWNARSHADRRGHRCPYAPAMQHTSAADRPASCSVSHGSRRLQAEEQQYRRRRPDCRSWCGPVGAPT